MSLDILKVAEVFSEMSVKVFAEHLNETLDPASQSTAMADLLKLQARLKQCLCDWEDLKGERADACYAVANDIYANKGNDQINVDPITGPWDVSEADFGVWIRAWVWVTAADIDVFLKLKKEKEW